MTNPNTATPNPVLKQLHTASFEPSQEMLGRFIKHLPKYRRKQEKGETKGVSTVLNYLVTKKNQKELPPLRGFGTYYVQMRVPEPSVGDYSEILTETCFYALIFATLCKTSEGFFPKGLIPPGAVSFDSEEEFQEAYEIAKGTENIDVTAAQKDLSNLSETKQRLPEKWSFYHLYLVAKWYEFREKCKECQNAATLWEKNKYRLHCINPKKFTQWNSEIDDILDYFIPLVVEDESEAYRQRYLYSEKQEDYLLWQLSRYRDNPSSSELDVNIRVLLEDCLTSLQKEKEGNGSEQSEKVKTKDKKRRREQKTLRLLKNAKVLDFIQSDQKTDPTMKTTIPQKYLARAQTQQCLETVLLWSHEKTKNTFETQPQKSLTDLAGVVLEERAFQETLPRYIFEDLDARKLSLQLGRLLRGKRNSYHGWTIKSVNI